MRTAPRPASCKEQWYSTIPYGTVHLRSGEQVRYFEAIKLALLSMWMIRQEWIFSTVQTTADKRCGQMRPVRNNAEKCRQTAETCGQTADMKEWKRFDIERLCLVTYPYFRMRFTIFFRRAKVLTVHSTLKVLTWSGSNRFRTKFTGVLLMSN